MKSGVKAFVVALVFSVLSFWINVLGFFVASLFLFSSMTGFLLTGIASIFSIYVVQNILGTYWAFTYGFECLFLLFLIKDYAIQNREVALSLLVSTISLVCLFGFFIGFVPFYILLLMIFACVYDIFSLSQSKEKTLIFSLVSVLMFFEFASVVNIVLSDVSLSGEVLAVAKTAITFLLSAPLVFAVVYQHKGELFRKNPLFLVIMSPIIAILTTVILLFY